MKNKKTQGYDGIPAEFMKFSIGSGLNIIKLITLVFHTILETKKIPEGWKTGIICNLYKNKEEKSNPNNY